MHNPPSEVSRDELITYAAEWGERISTHQLVRWHKAGLLPRPRRVHLGRGKGTVSRYPLEAAPQAVCLSRARRYSRSLDAMAWFTWCAHYPLTGYIRAMLLRRLADGEAELRQGLKQFEDEDPANPIEAAASERWPRAYGRVGAVYRPTLMRVLTEVMLGQFATELYSDDDFERIFPVERRIARKNARRGLSPVSISGLVEHMSHEISLPRRRAVLEKLSDEQLERTRDEALQVWTLLGSASGRAPGPMPLPVFELALLATRVSPHGRFFVNLVRSAMRERMREDGYDTLTEAFRAYLEQARPAR